jgi:hypothetical protein
VVIQSGDNRGQTVVQKNVVREMTRLGGWRGRATAFRLPEAAEDGLETAVILQVPRGGRILAVARAKN